ncbi:histidine kinase [Mucilaginibacter sp. KACC 22773]|uniref:sensor histidine kinase n=1 Tax=Mucilaginibacter sp. KACC 22773 TaxID=3025671 RepID=UPI002365D034|nr:histidine kinase [Mucilaginibacter sp. KACC 22773]WDF80755.1 histidine kinase [Mucilaginibacter sp. KACC 22773]
MKVDFMKFHKYRVVFYHLLWWFFYIFYELSSVYFAISELYLERYFSYFLVNVLLFYTHMIILNRTRHLIRARFFKVLLLIILETLVFLAIKLLLDYLYSNGNGLMFSEIRQFIALDFNRNLFFAALATLFWAASNISVFERKAKDAEIKQLMAARDNLTLEASLARSQNALLKQQINPHLLFNSLNFIHSLVYNNSPEAAQNVILLADMMRYGMEETDKDGKILLAGEVEQIHNLIRISQARFEHKNKVEFSVYGAIADQRLIPMVLITLVENVFKHGDLRDYPATIKLVLNQPGKLKFLTSNRSKAKIPFARLRSTGLENIRIRLDFTYGPDYTLSTREDDGFFEAELNIPL